MERVRLILPLVVTWAVGLGMPSQGRAQAQVWPREVVGRAVDALGGREALENLERVVLQGEAHHWAPEQSYTPGGEPRWSGPSALTITRDFARRSARLDWERRLQYPWPRQYRFSEVVAEGVGYVRGLDTISRPARATQTDPPMWAMSGNRLAAALRELKRTSPRLLLAMVTAPEQLAAGPVDPRAPEVTYREGDHAFTVFFDPETDLPARVRVLDHDTIQGDSTSDVVFSDWRSVAGVKVPHQIAYQLNGMQVARFHFTGVAVNPSLDPGLFAVPAEIVAKASRPAIGDVPYQWVLRRQSIGVYLDSDTVNYDREAPQGLRLVEIAPGVQHVVGGSHNSLVVEMKDHLIVFDAPINEWQSTWTINAAKAKFPGKPIRSLVLTHHHMDHTGGSRTYVAEGASVVVGAPAKGHFERVFRAPHTLDNDRLQQSYREATVVEVADHMTLADGQRQVQIHKVENRHADGMLIGYIPDLQLGFVTDLWSPTRDRGQTPHNAALFDAVTKLGIPRQARFAGGHGAVATVADLEALQGK